MYPVYRSFKDLASFRLSQDDVDGIQFLYGERCSMLCLYFRVSLQHSFTVMVFRKTVSATTLCLSPGYLYDVVKASELTDVSRVF